MANNRRRNFRKKFNYALYKENKHFKVTSIILVIVVIIAIIVLILKTYTNAKMKHEISNVQEEVKSQQESFYQSTENAVNSANNYKTDTIIRFSIAGLIDPENNEKYVKDDSSNNEFEAQIKANNIWGDEDETSEETGEEQNKENIDVFEDIEGNLNNSDFSIANYKISSNRNELFEEKVKQTGINMINLTNNSDEKIDNSYGEINNQGMQTIGNNYEKEGSSGRVNIINNKGINIAFIGYTAFDQSSRNAFNEDNAKTDLEFAKNNASVIVVMMDWKNTSDVATEEQKSQAQILADNGANLIIGNNQNNVQNMDILKGKDDKDCFVAYSLGNMFTTTNTEKNKSGMILQVQILVDKNENTSLNNVDYICTYVLKDKKSINVVDLKKELLNYEEAENNNMINSLNLNIDKSKYNKMKNAQERIKSIIK